MTSEEEFLKKLLETFFIEAEEHIEAITKTLIQLEEGQGNKKELIECLYREYHSLKGAARAVNLIYVEKLCHAVEQLFAAFKKNEIEFQQIHFDLCYESINLLQILLKESLETQDTHQKEVLDLIDKVKNSLSLLDSQTPTPSMENPSSLSHENSTTKPLIKESSGHKSDVIHSPPQIESSFSEKTIRIAQSKLEKLLLQIEELAILKNLFIHEKEELFNLRTQIIYRIAKFEPALFDTHIKTLRETDQNLMLEEKEFLSQTNQLINTLIKDQENAIHFTKGLLDSVLVDMKRALLQPFSSLVEMYPKMVRDLSKSLNKEVHLQIKGQDVEVDRRILEEIKDPLTHMIRNAVDHGIESPDIREQNGKPRTGMIDLQINSLSGGQIEIKISDDGRGIDFNRIKEKALKMGIATEKTLNEMGHEDIGKLAFISGLSTSEQITDLSGRGVGLSVVQEKIEKLSGHIYFESEPGSGTTFILTVPLTLATSRGVHVRVQAQEFIIPSSHVKRILRSKLEDIKTIETKKVISLEGATFSFAPLGELLGLETTFQPRSALFPVIIISSGSRAIALGIDEVLKEAEIFEKSLGKQLKRIRNITSATILTDGRVIPILDTNDLIKAAGGQVSIGKNLPFKPIEMNRKKIILVVEDSVTARTMLKNILENAGYIVKVAVDGAEGYAFLQKNSVDLVLTDVEMPRMNGFDLTKKIREDDDLKNLPVVICTTLASDQDKAKGIEVGVDAYIEKSQFNQNNLVEIIQTLV